MANFWVDFEDGSAGYVEAKDMREAATIADEKTGKKSKSVRTLPYPADPIIHRGEPHPEYGHCPAFCYTPKQCAGKSSCPKSYACSE